jgi:hypothetical protein
VKVRITLDLEAPSVASALAFATSYFIHQYDATRAPWSVAEHPTAADAAEGLEAVVLDLLTDELVTAGSQGRRGDVEVDACSVRVTRRR